MDEAALDGLAPAAREAIEAAQDRLERAFAAADLEATIGSSKELIESVAKAILERAGQPYGSHPSVDALANQALSALDLLPATLKGRPSLRRLSSSLIGVAMAIAELRDSDGTGHGKASRSDLDWSQAVLARSAATGWCNWMLVTAHRVLASRANLDQALANIGGGMAYRRHALADYLGTLGLVDLHEADQRRIGQAVARRWTVNETFMPLLDVIDPVIVGDAEYPAAFYEGLIEGLFLDHDGFIRTSGRDVSNAIGIGLRLSGAHRDRLFGELADRIDEAQASYAFDGQKSRTATEAIDEAFEQGQSKAVGKALQRISDRLRALVPPEDPEPFEPLEP